MTVKINTRKWDALKKTADAVGRREVRVGIFDPEEAGIAKLHEFGAPNADILERPFLRPAIKSRAVKRLQRRLAELLFAGRISAADALKQLGEGARDAVQQRIAQGTKMPKLDPDTVKQKGHSKKLIDTGRLLSAIAFRIVGRR